MSDPIENAPNNASPAPENTPVLIGNPKQAWRYATAIWAISFSTSVLVSPIVNSMKLLSSPLKLTLIAIAAIPAALLQIVTGRQVDQNGGMALIKRLRIISSLGSMGLFIFSARSDLSEIDSADWRYGLLIIFAVMANTAGALYQLFALIVYWSRPENKAHNIATYGGIGGLGPGLALIFLEVVKTSLGLTAALGGFFAISLLGTALTLFRLFPDFYHQLLTQKFSSEEARTIATNKGQYFFPKLQQNSLWQTLLDRRCFISMLNTLSSAGAALAASVSLYQILIAAAKLPTLVAVIITSTGSIWSTIVRALSGKPMQKYDPTHGAYTFMLASILACIGALMLAIPKTFPALGIIILANVIMNTGFGMGGAATFNLLIHWCKPNNTKLKAHDPGAMLGLVGSIGGSSPVIFPLIIAKLASDYDERGYSYGFFLTAALSFIAMILTGLMQHNATHEDAHFFLFWKKTPQLSQPVIALTEEQKETDDSPSIGPRMTVI